jgi:hypothetical protein
MFHVKLACAMGPHLFHVEQEAVTVMLHRSIALCHATIAALSVVDP